MNLFFWVFGGNFINFSFSSTSLGSFFSCDDNKTCESHVPPATPSLRSGARRLFLCIHGLWRAPPDVGSAESVSCATLTLICVSSLCRATCQCGAGRPGSSAVQAAPARPLPGGRRVSSPTRLPALIFGHFVSFESRNPNLRIILQWKVFDWAMTNPPLSFCLILHRSADFFLSLSFNLCFETARHTL